ncbi:MAG: hypothetical protein V8S89_04415 [Oscillospiraceae bacterium]
MDFIWDLLAGDKPDIIAGDDLRSDSGADGERAGPQQILRRPVPCADADGDLCVPAHAAPGRVHGVGRSVLVIRPQNIDRLGEDQVFCTKILSHCVKPPAILDGRQEILQEKKTFFDFFSFCRWYFSLNLV